MSAGTEQLTDPNDLVENMTKADLADIAKMAGSEPKLEEVDLSPSASAPSNTSSEDAAPPSSQPEDAGNEGEADLLDGLSDVLDIDVSDNEGSQQEKSSDAIEEALPEKQKEAFIAQRQEISSLKKENETLKRAGGGDAAEIQAELDSMKKRISQYEVIDMNEFREKYDAPIAKTLKVVASQITRLGGDDPEGEAKKLAGMNLQQRFQHIEANYGAPGATLQVNFSELDRLVDDRSEAIQDAQQEMIRLRAERSANISRGAEHMDQTVENLIGNNHFLLKKNDNPGWNEKVDARVDRARSLASSLSDNSGEVLLKAALADEYLAIIAVLSQQRNEYADRFGKLRRASPDLGAGGATNSSGRRAYESSGSSGRTADEVADIVSSRIRG